MSAARSGATPATVAPVPGFDAEKLMQRFAELDARNRSQLLETALGMIERQRDEKLPPREREAKRLIDRIAHLIDLLHGHGHEDTLHTGIWRAALDQERAQLAAMGLEYFSPTDSREGLSACRPRLAR